jgi:peptide chain release factor 1
VEIVESSDSKMVAQISGKKAWSSFEHESGQHVVQRVPPTESKGRRQTSIISVAVMPLQEERNYDPLEPSEYNVTMARGSGPGGQHRNMTDSAVRMVHKESKLQVLIDGRNQHDNKRKALQILTARVREDEWGKKDKVYNEERRDKMGDGGRGQKVRTYNFIDKFVKDHRTGRETNQVKKVMKGQFSLVM